MIEQNPKSFVHMVFLIICIKSICSTVTGNPEKTSGAIKLISQRCDRPILSANTGELIYWSGPNLNLRPAKKNFLLHLHCEGVSISSKPYFAKEFATTRPERPAWYSTCVGQILFD